MREPSCQALPQPDPGTRVKLDEDGGGWQPWLRQQGSARVSLSAARLGPSPGDHGQTCARLGCSNPRTRTPEPRALLQDLTAEGKTFHLAFLNKLVKEQQEKTKTCV